LGKKITHGAVNPEPGSSKNYKTGSWRSMRPVLNKEKCKKCWLCFVYCPEGCIKKTEEGPDINLDYCKGCGICAVECPFDALDMIEEEK